MKYSISKFEYSSKTGVLKEVIHCDALGNPLFRSKVSSLNNQQAAIYDLIGIQDEDASGYFNSQTAFFAPEKMMKFQKASIKRVVHYRDSMGFTEKITFHANNSDLLSESLTNDANGAYGLSFKVDSISREIEMILIDKNGLYINGINGVSKYRTVYSNFNIESTVCYHRFYLQVQN